MNCDCSTVHVTKKITIDAKGGHIAIKLPKVCTVVEASQNVVIINLNEITADRIEFEGREPSINWNKETDDDLQKINEMTMTVVGDVDLRKYVYSKKFTLTGQGTVYLPTHIEHLDTSTDVIIKNTKEVTIENLDLKLGHAGDQDLTQYHVTKHLYVDSQRCCSTIKLPEMNAEVKLSHAIVVQNLNEIMADKITFEGRKPLINWNRETEEDLQNTTEIDIVIGEPFDLTRFFKLKKVKIECEICGKAKVKLPLSVVSVDISRGVDVVNLNQLTQLTELGMPMQGDVDLTHFTNLKRITAKYGKDSRSNIEPIIGTLILPSYLEFLQYDDQLLIGNRADITIDQLVVDASMFIWENILDLTEFKVTGMIEIKKENPFSNAKIKLPPFNHHVKIASNDTIVNKDTVTIENLEVVQQNRFGFGGFGGFGFGAV